MKSMRNSVQLIGHLGRDPEVKMFDQNKRVTFTMATTDSYKNNKGEKIEDTQWHTIVMWGALADTAQKYLKKGKEVVIEGRIVYRPYETESGEKKVFTEINASDLLLIGKKD